MSVRDDWYSTPRQWWPTTRRVLVCRIGRRGAALLFFAFLDVVYSLSLYFPAPAVKQTPSIAFVEAVAPLPMWATMWAIAAVLCFVSAFRTNDKVGFSAAILMKVLWGLLFVAASFAHIERAWVSAGIWLCLAGWVAIIASWPEPASRGTTRTAPPPPPDPQP